MKEYVSPVIEFVCVDVKDNFANYSGCDYMAGPHSGSSGSTPVCQFGKPYGGCLDASCVAEPDDGINWC